MRTRWGFVWLSTVLSLSGWSQLQAEPSLPHLFGDHMVFQRDTPIRVWGTADAGERVTVELAGRTESTVADARRHWKVSLPAMAAGGPFTLRVLGRRSIVLRDVMVGEVWVASGQSNMAFVLRSATGWEHALPNADHPEI